MFCVIKGSFSAQKHTTKPDSAVFEAARRALALINTEYAPSLLYPFELKRGREFEGVLLSKFLAPRLIKALLKAFWNAEASLKIAAVIGQVAPDSFGLSADGAAFTRADELLSGLKDGGGLVLRFDTGLIDSELMDAALGLMSALTAGWTVKQQELAWAMEELFGQQKLVGRRFGITPPAVSKQLKAMHYEAYRAVWDALENCLANMDEKSEKTAQMGFAEAFGAGQRLAANGKDKAIGFYEKALVYGKNEFTPDSWLLAPVYNALGTAYSSCGLYREAESAFKESLRVQSGLPRARLLYIHTLAQYAASLLGAGQYDGALEKYKAAEELCTGLFGDHHPLVGDICNCIASAHIRSGAFDAFEKAKEYYDKALSAKIRSGAPPLSLAAIYYNIGAGYMSQNRIVLAIPYYKEALDIFETNLPPRDEMISTMKKYLSHALTKAREQGLPTDLEKYALKQ